MDAIGTLTTVITTKPVLPVKTGGGEYQAPVLSKPASSETALPLPGAGGGVDIQAAEQKRYERVLQAARNIANEFVVSDRRFTIFKDSSGQYITRFTNLRDGKVTYIPEPELFSRQSSSAGSGQSLVDIQA